MIQYLTLNGYFYTWLYFVTATQFFIIEKCSGSRGLEKPVEFLYELSLSFEFVITLLYWAVLYGGGQKSVDLFLNMGVHAVPLIGLVLELPFNCFRFGWTRLILIEGLAIIYGIGINLPYSLTDEPVYPVLKWVDGISWGLFAGALVGVAFMFCLGRATAWLKAKCQRPTHVGTVEPKSETVK